MFQNLRKRLRRTGVAPAVNPIIDGYEDDLRLGISIDRVLTHAKKKLTFLYKSRNLKLAAELRDWIDRKESE